MSITIEDIYMYCRSSKHLKESEAKVFETLNDMEQQECLDTYLIYQAEIKVYKEIMTLLEME